MPQIKLGFDRVPVPTTTRLEELKNFPTGETLRDRTGNILYTEVDAPLRERAKTKNATPVYINNETDAPLKIEEQFPDTSEVSSTLLGIDRAETQLSLFSDVSSYGLNEEEFEYFSGLRRDNPRPWYIRDSDVYGTHYNVKLVEETNEQALIVSLFPVPFTFPDGPEYADIPGKYNPEIYEKYLNFVRLGNLLYDKFVAEGYQEFADAHFLPNSYLNAPTDDIKVNYGEQYSTQQIFNQLGRWTYAWMDLRDNLLMDPRFNNTKIEFLSGYSADNTLPGKDSKNNTEAVLQTRKAYRYQPGRISGFTFGFKCSFDPASTQNSIEWGVANDTDMYMFQVRGSRLSIIRRSTIPLPTKILTDMGFTIEDQVNITNPTPFVDNDVYELAISQDFFNGDTMNGNGPSGYNIDVTKVTMYKVEFGWYGAIGARFLAYVPTGNGECRWVVLHTLVIENGLGEPCLKDPYFKFKYILNLKDSGNLREPQFLYKYGASCYIDGGNDNAGTVYAYQSEERVARIAPPLDLDNDGDIDIEDTIIAGPSGGIIFGIQPKAEIFNSDGTGIKNKRDTYIEDLKVISDALAKLEIIEVPGCPGFGHSYAPSLTSNETGKTLSTLSFSLDRTELLLSDEETFDGIQDGAHLIGEGLFGFYLQKKLNPGAINNTAFIKAISYVDPGIESFNAKIDDEFLLNNGEVVSYANYFENGRNVRFSEYNAFAASDSPLTGQTIKVNFLNPRKEGNLRHLCNFFIGVSQDKPKQQSPLDGGNISLIDRDTGLEKPLTLDDIMFVDFTCDSVLRNEKAHGTHEITPKLYEEDFLMGMDFRIPRVEGEDFGVCSQIIISEKEKIPFSVKFSTSLSGPDFVGESANYLIFDLEPTILINSSKIIGAEIGLLNESGIPESSGIRFISNIIINEFVNNSGVDIIEYAIEIDALPDVSAVNFDIYLSPLQMSDHAIISETFFSDFDFKPLYVIIGLRDNAEVNNVSIEEIRNDGKRSFVPDWLTNNNLTLRFPGGSSVGLPPANFVSNERLSGNSIDVQSRQPLRPGKIITTIYADPSNLELVKLNNIYGADRQVIAPGDINAKATFITARSLDTTATNNITISLVTREI